jgi:hypothetical protein
MLCPVDWNENALVALEYAASFARQHGVQLYVLYVLPAEDVRLPRDLYLAMVKEAGGGSSLGGAGCGGEIAGAGAPLFEWGRRAVIKPMWPVCSVGSSALVFLFGFSPHQTQGTALALLGPPIGMLAAWTYYVHGYVDLKTAAWICLGFFVGGLLGAQLATSLSDTMLERIFGVALFFLRSSDVSWPRESLS